MRTTTANTTTEDITTTVLYEDVFLNNTPECGLFAPDVTPEEIEYVGYFNVAEVLYRIDRPKSS